MHAMRRHFAKKEAFEHQQAQAALACGDLKEWHKHEAKAHRAGSHARGNGLIHSEYMFKENMPPTMMPTMTTTTSSNFLAPLPPAMGVVGVSEGLPATTLYEVGGEMEPTVVVEPMITEEARTIVEYGEPVAAMTVVDAAPPVAFGGATVVGGEEFVRYGEPQFVGETVATTM